MLSPTPMRQMNPAAFLANATSPSSSVRFFIPPPESRAAFIQPKLQHAANTLVITRTLGLLKPFSCKSSTYLQRKTDTARAVACTQAQPRLHRLNAVDHATYGGMLRDTRRISPTYCSGQRLSTPGQSNHPTFKRGGVCQ